MSNSVILMSERVMFVMLTTLKRTTVIKFEIVMSHFVASAYKATRGRLIQQSRPHTRDKH